MKLVSGLVKIGKVIVDHGPQILTAVGIIGFISSTIMAVNKTPEDYEALERAKEEKGEELTAKEVVKTTWKYYIFPVIITVLSIVSILAARRIDSGRTAALLTACKVTEEASQQFDNATREVVGEKKYEEIKQKVAEKDISDNPVDGTRIVDTKTGDFLYFERYSKTYIKASRDFIDRSRNEFCAFLMDYDSASLNDYLRAFGIKTLDTIIGEEFGWRLDKVKQKCGGKMPELIFEYYEVDPGKVIGEFWLEVDPSITYKDYHS
jgi:hypothetical protein